VFASVFSVGVSVKPSIFAFLVFLIFRRCIAPSGKNLFAHRR
jgi:hypothetical protein